MFTGLVEEMGTVRERTPSAAGARMVIACDVVRDGLAIGDSVSVNGACLTVVHMVHDAFAVAPGIGLFWQLAFHSRVFRGAWPFGLDWCARAPDFRDGRHAHASWPRCASLEMLFGNHSIQRKPCSPSGQWSSSKILF